MRFIGEKLPRLRPAFNRFAPLLAKFRNLRNDCNYESLLVANEVNHPMVTQGFKNLVAAADGASQIATDVAIGAYLENLKSAEYFHTERSAFHAAHSRYLHGEIAERFAISGHFDSSLRQKFGKSSSAMRELQRIIDCLDWPETPSGIDVERFLEPIMYDMFQGKQALMQRWLADIQSLEGALLTTE